MAVHGTGTKMVTVPNYRGRGGALSRTGAGARSGGARVGAGGRGGGARRGRGSGQKSPSGTKTCGCGVG
ncbi:hypothetical protein DID88_010107 [Monilinia fructigena]|uniref:Uncharacterized protein n=1 Tax=Monilinia fructigena TaxID=38457 RepID=A0A395ILI7_9HELO|nr:hypothetical protein DID88_010107 [Monilinia fructigena]